MTAAQSLNAKTALMCGPAKLPVSLPRIAGIAALGAAVGSVWYIAFVLGVSRLH